MTVIAQHPLGPLARGAIGAGGIINQASFSLLANGTFMHKTTQSLIGICGDERCDIHGSRLLLPAGFGGFAGLAMTDALTTRIWYKPGMVFLEHAKAMLADLRGQLPSATFAVHTDTAALAMASTAASGGLVECGCAAIAKARAVLELLVTQQAEIDPRYRGKIVAHAQELLRSGYIQPGTAKVVSELGAAGAATEVLDGEHEGVLLFWNMREGTVLNRPALYEACRAAGLPVLYAFEYDVWALRATAMYLTHAKQQEADFYFAGGDALKITTIRAIASPDLVVVTYK